PLSHSDDGLDAGPRRRGREEDAAVQHVWMPGRDVRHALDAAERRLDLRGVEHVRHENLGAEARKPFAPCVLPVGECANPDVLALEELRGDRRTDLPGGAGDENRGCLHECVLCGLLRRRETVCWSDATWSITARAARQA